jgi:putative ABC transport system substrate-binding protein
MVPLASPGQSRVHRIAILVLGTDEPLASFSAPLQALGYVEGKNVSFTYRSADGDSVRLSALAEELVQAKPDLLLAGIGTLAPQVLEASTRTIPIVFSAVGDPVGTGLVKSLARPGGNATGLSPQTGDLKSKQLQLLLSCVPGQRAIGVLINVDTPYSALAMKELAAAAEAVGVRLERLEIRKPADFTAARMEAMTAAGATSFFVIEDPVSRGLQNSILEQTSRLRLPVMTGLREFAPAGALMAYGPDRDDWYRQAAVYVDKILKGAHPSDLPIEQPTNFSLVINLRTAKAMGIVVPPSLLAQAGDVIE